MSRVRPLIAAITAVSMLIPAGGNANMVSAGDGPSQAAVSEALAAPGPTFIFEDQDGIQVRAVMSGWNLDQYLYRSQGPITFSVDVTSHFGPVDAEGHPVLGNGLFGKVGRLTLRVYDVDDDYSGTDFQPERDLLVMNGSTLPGYLAGTNGQWSVSTFAVDLNQLKLPTAANPQGRNDFEVRIDTANSAEVWAVTVDWAALRLEIVPQRPVAFIHGIDANADGSNNMGEIRAFYEQNNPALAGHAANPTALGSIGDRAAALAPTIDGLLQASGTSRVNLVGHSMGGLVARRYAHDHPEKVDSLVMLGTPNGGSQLIDAACALQNSLEVSAWAVSPFGILDLPCAREGQPLFENTTGYVQNVFNVSYADTPFVRYLTLAGVAEDRIWLDGPDDGWIRVAEAEYLSQGDPDHPGFHEVRPHYNLTHDGLVHAPATLFPDTLCELYPEAAFCATRAAAQGTPALQELAATPGAIPNVLGFNQVATVPAGGSVQIPATFEGATAAYLVVLATTAEGLAVSYAGTTLPRADLLGVPAFGAPLANPADGLVTITNSGPASVNTQVAVLVQTDRVLSVAPAATFTKLGAPLGVTVTLSGTVSGELPTLSLVSADGTKTDIPLTAGDPGTWTGQTAPMTGGLYRLEAQVGGARPRFDFEIVSVSRSVATISAGFSERVVGLEDGLADALVLTPSIDVSLAGRYHLSGRLIDGSGIHIADANATGDLSVGANPIDLSFDGRAIYRAGRPGPYRLVDLVLSRADSSSAIEDEVADLGTTGLYSIDQFQHFVVEFDRASFTDQGVDTNGDGFFDSLRFSGGVRLDAGGTYAINARLLAPDGTQVAEAGTVASFAAGAGGFGLSFDGQAIAQSRKDGPYTVVDLSMYATGDIDRSGYIVTAHRTAPYTIGQFGADTTPPVSEAGPLDPIYTSDSISVPFTASDAGGSGVASVELWVRYRSSEAQAWGTWSQALTGAVSPFSYTFSNFDGNYEFYTVAIDGAGNRETAPTTADAATRRDAVDDPPDFRVTYAYAFRPYCMYSGCPNTTVLIITPVEYVKVQGVAADDRSVMTVTWRLYGVKSNGSRTRIFDWKAASADDGSFDNRVEAFTTYWSTTTATAYTAYDVELRFSAGGRTTSTTRRVTVTVEGCPQCT